MNSSKNMFVEEVAYYTGAVSARHHCPTNKNQLPKVRLRRGVRFNGVSAPDRPKLAGQGLFDPRLAAVQNRGHQIAPGSALKTRLLALPLLAGCLLCSWSVNNTQCAGFENTKRVG